MEGKPQTQFPILYEDGVFRIYKNPTNEIFIEEKESGTTIRMNPYCHGNGGIQFTTGGCVVEPIMVNHMIGWRVGPR